MDIDGKNHTTCAKITKNAGDTDENLLFQTLFIQEKQERRFKRLIGTMQARRFAISAAAGIRKRKICVYESGYARIAEPFMIGTGTPQRTS